MIKSRVQTNVQRSMVQRRLESMKAYKQAKRASAKSLKAPEIAARELKVSVAQQTDKPALVTEIQYQMNELKESIKMVMQDLDFSRCLRGLTTVRLITAQHRSNCDYFQTYVAILMESGVIERLIRIIETPENEFDSQSGSEESTSPQQYKLQVGGSI